MIDELGFGNRLDMTMKKAGYSNSQLTKELNLSKNAIGNYRNNQIPNAIILYNISQKLGTTMEYLLTGKEITELKDIDKEIITYFHQLPEREQIRELGRLEAKAEQYRDDSQERLSGSRTG